MSFYDQFNKKILLITTPPRSAGMFLYYMLKDYFSDSYEVDVVFSKHNPSFLTVENKDMINIVTNRNPIDMVSSMINYSWSDIIKNEVSKESVIEGTSLIMDKFYKNFFVSKNNILIEFDELTLYPQNTLKFICDIVDKKYSENYIFNIDRIKKNSKNSNDAYKGNFPRKKLDNYKDIQEYVNKNILVNKLVTKNNNFINSCLKNKVGGLYGKNINS